MAFQKYVSLGIALVCFSLAPAAYAVVASGTVHQIRQPDGRALDVIQRGDERLQWVERGNGYTVAQGANGYWYYVQRYEAGRPILTARRADLPDPTGIQPHQHPLLETLDPAVPFDGTALRKGPMAAQLLMILIVYNDTPATYRAASGWANLIGNSLNPDAKTIADYYQQASYGAVSISPAQESHGTSNDGVIGWLPIFKPHPDPEAITDSALIIAPRSASWCTN